MGVTINPWFTKEQKKCLLLSPGTSRCKTELLCGARRQWVGPRVPWALRSLGLADLVAPKGQRGGQTAPKVSDARSAGSQVEPCPDPRPASEEWAFHPGPWPARELGRRQGVRAGVRESGHTLVHPTGPPEPPYGRERTPPQPVKPQPGPKLRGCTGGQMPALGPSSSLRPAVTFWGSLRGFTAPATSCWDMRGWGDQKHGPVFSVF